MRKTQIRTGLPARALFTVKRMSAYRIKKKRPRTPPLEEAPSITEESPAASVRRVWASTATAHQSRSHRRCRATGTSECSRRLSRRASGAWRVLAGGWRRRRHRQQRSSTQGGRQDSRGVAGEPKGRCGAARALRHQDAPQSGALRVAPGGRLVRRARPQHSARAPHSTTPPPPPPRTSLRLALSRRWTVSDALQACGGSAVGLWIDLTNTRRYYEPRELPQSVRYLKFQTAGHDLIGEQVRPRVRV